ncbi:carbohydrate ABC transporter permease [Halocatena marina]|uniref:carbohydrate ABC transporter permease n=1 Tax=Halocatena marina TaxID=2934937 RepID=UPI0022247566|nr:sugar ABC transporter permease [Halocatena marina]
MTSSDWTIIDRAKSVRRYSRLDEIESVLRDHWFSYLLVVPIALFLVSLMWFPFMRGIWMSFHKWPFVGEPQWVGLDNYTFLMSWDVFFTSMKATVLFATTTFIQLVVALAAALAVSQISRFKSVINGVFLIPYAMPPLVSGTIWVYLLEPDLGPVFGYLTKWGVLAESIYWTANGDTALAVITFATAWTFWPFMFIIFTAGLQKIPDEYYETARVYGANRWQTFRNITLPQLKGPILVAISIRMVWNLSKVSQPLQMTQGGPGYETSILAVLLYNYTYDRGQLGFAFTLGVILFVITFGFVFLFIREFERENEVGRA